MLLGSADRADEDQGRGFPHPLLVLNLTGRHALSFVPVGQRIVLLGRNVADDIDRNRASMHLCEEIEQDRNGMVALAQNLVAHRGRIGVFSFDRQRLPSPGGKEYTARYGGRKGRIWTSSSTSHLPG